MHHADHWRSIVGQSDEQVIDLIQNDQINILVDLAGHTNEKPPNTFLPINLHPCRSLGSAIRTQQGSMPSIIASLTTLPILSAKSRRPCRTAGPTTSGHVVL